MGTNGGETEVSWKCYHLILWFCQSILGLDLHRNSMLRTTAWLNTGTTQNSTVCTALLAKLSSKCTIWWEITKELTAKCTCIHSLGHSKDSWTLLLSNLRCCIKFWEAPLSSSTLSDTAPNRRCTYGNLWAKFTKKKKQSFGQKALFALFFYATVVFLFSFFGKVGISEDGGGM